MAQEPLSAHGKAILFGEHAVVYGRPALAAGLSAGLRCRSCVPTPRRVRVRVAAWELDADERSPHPVGAALRRLLRRMPGGQGGCELDIDPGLPAGAGLGSSAALAVVLVRGLARARGVRLSADEVRALAHDLEKVFHGEPSGLDDTVATFGGVCLFRRGGWSHTRYPGPLGERVTPEARRLPLPLPALLVGDSGVPRSTRRMVDRVRRRREEDRPGVERLFDRIEACLWDGLAALGRRDGVALGAALSRNQRALSALGLSTPEIDEMVALASDAGATGAKLTGAGGGGCVIAVAPGREDAVLGAWRHRGYRGWLVANGGAS